jgi:hypothetical protein
LLAERRNSAAGANGLKAETIRRRLRQLDVDLAEGIGRLRTIDRALFDSYQ